jgi:hypothetical protein
MPRIDEAKFVLHGLDVDNRIVRAEVFVRKLRTLLSALNDADKFANGKRGFVYMISGLGTGSAAVTIRQKQKAKERPARSGIAIFEAAASAIYNGDRSVERYPPLLIRKVRNLGQGVAKNFSHGEIAFHDDNVIRIDDYLLRQSDEAYELITHGPDHLKDNYYRGLASGTFDGVLKEIDARGTMLRGKLVLSAGGVELDCVMNKERVPEARDSFDKRVIVEGMAHYDGQNQLPVRVDVRTIRAVDSTGGLVRWQGAFDPPRPDESEEDW